MAAILSSSQRHQEIGSVEGGGPRISKMRDRLVTQVEAKIRKMEVELGVETTKGRIRQLITVLDGMGATLAAVMNYMYDILSLLSLDSRLQSFTI